ncbi:nucleotidyltransferase family protein [uncultured Polaribacter sp.]|uniref:nucleotidyltransferase family protein n=1 Tax=uncultured Polaribacter sp. TaxID=174711 RepID=UPI0026059454|nr:nucleotidyltransferase family protein [uncultured Polaribacter sp.]
MTYKETLTFIATCLTISLEESNKAYIKQKLVSKDIDWDSVVKVSTAHYVFPALYCNLKRVAFLQFLPDELVNYMQHITDLNRDRNIQIIAQAKELNTLLLANNITPVFFKGTGNLLAGIYEDIAERMVGDIDFIFSEQDYPKAIKVICNFNYSKVDTEEYYLPPQKHYRRLQKENSIAAVEIHKEILIENYAKEFNYTYVKKDCQVVDGVTVLSYANKLNISILANQINDKGYYYKAMALRNAYDVFLLSKKTNANLAVHSIQKLSTHLNCFLAACYQFFNNVSSLEYTSNKEVTSYLKRLNSQYQYPKITKFRHQIIKSYFFIELRCQIINRAITTKGYLFLLYKRLTSKEWRQEKWHQIVGN